MQAYQQRFIELAIEHNALKFGEFTLKSGRKSPYFFNAGSFNTGQALATLGQCYADALAPVHEQIDLLFGPAYKGIPLASATAVALADHHNINLPFCFNRKEAKTHGEGGQLVGAPLNGRVTIIDDVITAGTAIREVIDIVHQNGAEVTQVIIGLDRQEPDNNGINAITALEQEFGLSVIRLVTLSDIIAYLEKHPHQYQGVSRQLKDYQTAVNG